MWGEDLGDQRGAGGCVWSGGGDDGILYIDGVCDLEHQTTSHTYSLVQRLIDDNQDPSHREPSPKKKKENPPRVNALCGKLLFRGSVCEVWHRDLHVRERHGL